MTKFAVTDISLRISTVPFALGFYLFCFLRVCIIQVQLLKGKKRLCCFTKGFFLNMMILIPELCINVFLYSCYFIFFQSTFFSDDLKQRRLLLLLLFLMYTVKNYVGCQYNFGIFRGGFFPNESFL